MGIRIELYRFIKGIEYQGIIISVTDDIGYDTSVIKIQDRTEIYLLNLQFLDLWADIILKFCYIRQPLFIRLICMKITAQKIFRYVLRILCLSCTAVITVLDRRLDTFDSADSQDSLIVDVDIIFPIQIIVDPTIPFTAVFVMDLFDDLCDSLVLFLPLRWFLFQPSIVRSPGNLQDPAAQVYRIFMFLTADQDRLIDISLPYFR